MSPVIAAVLGAIAAIACTVLSCIYILPEKKRKTLPKFFQIIHDIFNFKYLVIEQIMKIMYIFSTLFCIGAGFFLLFSGTTSYDFYYDRTTFESTAGIGFIMILVGPILIRIAYEFTMMAILAINNIISINKKLKNQNEDEVAAEPAPAPEKMVYCIHCGTRYNECAGPCTNCGQTNK